MEEDEEMTPFWLQQTSRGGRGSGSRISSTFLNSGLFLIVSVLAIVSVIVFIIIPSIVSFTSQVLKPHNVKKSWDSLNLVLVLFAIVCGFLSRNTIQNNSNSSYNTIQLQEERRKSNPTTPRRWNYEYDQDRTAYKTTTITSSTSTMSRLRSFRSYPDLRQESVWAGSGEERWRFYDDTHLRNQHQGPDPDQLHREFHPDRPRQQLDQDQATEAAAAAAAAKPEEVLIETKDIAVDTFLTNREEVKDPYFSPPLTLPLPKSTPLPPPPATELENAGKRKVKRTYRDPGSEKRAQRMEVQRKEVQVPSFTPPPPPVTSRKSEKTRGKKKNQRQKSVENLGAFFDSLQLPSTTVSFLPPPSPPPPPPPPFLQNLFSSKKKKAKKITYRIPPPPPPPPPPATTSSRRYPVQAKTSIPQRVEESFGSGGMSPLRLIPPPPPPPPFKMPAWKFVVEGDYVRVGSFGSSRSGSPDLDSPEDVFSDRESPVAGAGTPATALFCPSPDVDTKADNFIARFRAGLKLEKINSVKGRSNLGPSPSDFGIKSQVRTK